MCHHVINKTSLNHSKLQNFEKFNIVFTNISQNRMEYFENIFFRVLLAELCLIVAPIEYE